jgi:uncharacterized membrane protein YkvA (DUF1232 family)
MEVAENNKVQTKVQKAKRKTIEIKDDIGHFISESPLFRLLKNKTSLYFHNPEQLNEEITRLYNDATHEEGKKSVADMWQKVKELFYMVKDAFNNKYKELPKVKIAIGGAVILYAILPTDLVPDILPVFGFTDDAALLGWFMKQAAKEIKQYEQWRSQFGGFQTA